MKFVRLFILAVLAASAAVCDKPRPASPIWDGNDGSQPPLIVYSSYYLEEPVTPEVARATTGGKLWTIVEGWDSKTPGRPSVDIMRTRLVSHTVAVRAVAYPDHPNRYRAYIANHQQWDATPVLGSHSLTSTSAHMGVDQIWFVQDKELVGVAYQSIPPSPADSAAWHQNVVKIARAVQAKIIATGESGAGEPDPDDPQPPTLTLSANPSELWPPNHKMVKIKVTVQVQDNLDPNPVVKLVGVTSSAGDPADIQIDADGTIWLRAERAGNENQRVYTITYKATDGSGNVRTASVQVVVPHDQGKKK